MRRFIRLPLLALTALILAVQAPGHAHAQDRRIVCTLSLPLLALTALILAVQAPGLAHAQDRRIVCTLILDAATGAALRDEGDCDGRVTPASTFKIPLAVIAFERGLLAGPHAPFMSWQPGDPDWGGADWTRDTDPARWMRYSVVWYSQRLTRALGAGTVADHLRAFGFGNADMSGDPGFDNGVDRAWLTSSLIVSPREQAMFLRRLVHDDLPVAPQAMAQARGLVPGHEAGGWRLFGKTGAAYPRRADRSFDRTRGWGWFVGWADSGDRRLIFVRLTQELRRNAQSPGHATRDALLAEWPGLVRR